MLTAEIMELAFAGVLYFLLSDYAKQILSFIYITRRFFCNCYFEKLLIWVTRKNHLKVGFKRSVD